MARLEAGQPAPDFSLQADDGSTVSLSDLSGQTVALYFYPKDDTSGCTASSRAILTSWCSAAPGYRPGARPGL